MKNGSRKRLENAFALKIVSYLIRSHRKGKGLGIFIYLPYHKNLGNR